MTELPYQVEYAKSGKAGCKGCKQKIDQGTLRIAVMVQSAFRDGKQPNWHHEDCFFSKQHPVTFSDIANFNKLTNDDQKRIKSKIENYSVAVMPDEPDAGGKAKSKGKKRAADSGSSQALKDYGIEYAKSSRAACRHCDIKICKGEVRIRKTVYDTEVGRKYGGQPLWHHVNCFAEKRSELMFFAGGESLPGFKELNEDDQKMVQDAIKPYKKDEVPIKKLKAEPKDAEELKEEKQKAALIEKQNTLFQENRKALSELSELEVQYLLDLNEQKVTGGPNERLDHLADCLTFGALLPCPECKHGQLVLDSFGYKCTGNLTEWTKCSYVTQEPKRELLKLTIAYNFKPNTDVRLFSSAPRPVVIVKDEPSTSTKSEMPVPPLKNLQFFLYGKLKNKEETKRRILKLGGLVVSKLTDTVVAVVSTKKDVERMPDKMQEIEKLDVVVVEDTFLDSIDPKGTIVNSLQVIKENNIAQWGADPVARLPQDVVDGKSIPKSGSVFVKSSKSASVKLKIQGGTAVDPQSGLADVAHVYQARDGTKYTVVLTQTDIVAQKNSYYKMQVLEGDAARKYWLFRSWGRIGTTIGGSKVEICSSAMNAVEEFKSIYGKKTQNRWNDRHNFMKKPGMYYPLDVDYSDGTDDVKLDPEADANLNLEVDAKSKLPEPVQKLIIKIFDVVYMKRTMLEFELDTEKMPLGKLSKNQLISGYKVLSELLQLIEQGKSSQSKIIDATNRFFTLIPHDFGVNNAPLLDNVETIKTKTEMLDNLLEIEIAYSLLKSEGDESVGVIDAHFLKLKCDIAPILKESPEYQLISEYLHNTHASTHSYYKLEIEEVFKVVREGEDKRYQPFKKLHNRRLLWHGSRITNFAGILSQGLRIAPPEAPVTGYMFGKGIYFADMVSKSANYCYTSTTDPIGVLMLCEVALGTMQECYAARNVKLSPHEHSAWGVGRTQPDPALSRTLDDVLVPLGTPLTSPTDTSLLYNEFIVYDVAQVNVKYLLQVKFIYDY